jgi:hypothetical protein
LSRGWAAYREWVRTLGFEIFLPGSSKTGAGLVNVSSNREVQHMVHGPELHDAATAYNPLFNDAIIFAVLTTGAVLIATQLGRIVRAAMAHRTIRRAIEKDSPVVTDLLQGVQERPAPATDDRTGILLIAIAAAIFLFGVIQGGEQNIRGFGGIALFPLFVGAALIGRFLYTERGARG